MISVFKRAFDAWRGRGSYAITIPPMDGALRPNDLIEEAPALLDVEAPDNLVYDGARVLFSSGGGVHILETDGVFANSALFATFETSVAALGAHPGGCVAVGANDGRIVLRGGRYDGKVLTNMADRPIVCPTALLFADEKTLLVALGSQQYAPEKWKYDLMQRNATGSVWRLDLESGEATCLADRLAYPNGLLLARGGGVLVSESWRNRLIRLRAGARPQTELADIAGYPARLAAAADGAGSWLAVFAPRSQLIEFTLRERDYCRHMMREIEPQHWIAPSLAPIRSFLEPMQLGGLKQLGILKPWSPTRSYGLVVRLDDEQTAQASFHSRADGRRHGVTSCIEIKGRLLATSKGGDVIVSIPVGS